MKIDGIQFKKAFIRKAAPVAQTLMRRESAQQNLDNVSLSSTAATDTSLKNLTPNQLDQEFSQMVLAIGSATSLAGIPVLASMSQEIGQALISAKQENELAESIANQYQGFPVVQDARLSANWQRVSETTASPFSAPVLVNSFFVDAQADSRGMYIGTNALGSYLSDDSVLAFTLAHEEAHRQNRDSAGSKGLETLTELTKHDDDLFAIAMSALKEGRHQNEREADIFGAKAVLEMGQELEPVYEFLAEQTEGLQHPGGHERCRNIRENLDS